MARLRVYRTNNYQVELAIEQNDVETASYAMSSMTARLLAVALCEAADRSADAFVDRITQSKTEGT